jgi:hypothetical protein
MYRNALYSRAQLAPRPPVEQDDEDDDDADDADDADDIDMPALEPATFFDGAPRTSHRASTTSTASRVQKRKSNRVQSSPAPSRPPSAHAHFMGHITASSPTHRD